MMGVNVLVEGTTDLAVAKRLLRHVGLAIESVYGLSGKSHLLKLLHGYNQAARFRSWFVLVDLDNDAVCAAEAIRLWLPQSEDGMRLRVAVRAIESWIMADLENFAYFLNVASNKLPYNPDLEVDPKKTLIHVVRSSRNKDIRVNMLPPQGSSSSVGTGYTAKLVEFIENHWQPGEAAKRSDSLRRCIHALGTLKDWNRQDTDDS